ncbi:hypothetical protein OIO90_002448 [Microbotryomycetes sp. JL221]|nr:hypothetical protein OIO90_002448 [Microbotryomycetes sp. JL221]
MDSVLSGALDGLFTGENAWIAPWAQVVLSRIKPGQNPWIVIMQALKDPFYPEVSSSFIPQLWFLLGLFIFISLVVLSGLILRLVQGRFWLLHRIDRTVLIPNISVWFGICALVYTGLGMAVIISAIQIVKGAEYPRCFLALQIVWPAVLWIGIYAEIWATFAAWYIRKFGAHFKESRFKSCVAAVLPLAFPMIAVVPCAVTFTLGAKHFNKSISLYSAVQKQLVGFKNAWTPALGLDIGKLVPILSPVQKLGSSMLSYKHWTQIAFSYAAAMMLVTMITYVIGASLEITHLRRLARSIESKVAASPIARQQARMANLRSPQLGGLISEKQATTNVVESSPADTEWLTASQKQVMLLLWAAQNRTQTALLITIMLVANSAMLFWYAFAPLEITANSAQFQTIIIVSCWLNGVLSALVSLLLLFRSLDGGNLLARKLQQLGPWLPLPPAIGIRAGQDTTIQQKTVFGEVDESTEGVSTVNEKEGFGGKVDNFDVEATRPYQHGIIHKLELDDGNMVELDVDGMWRRGGSE